jgi:zinc protease
VTPRGKDGVDQVLDELLDYKTANQDRLAFQRAPDEIGANEPAGTSFSVVVFEGHFWSTTA